MTQPLEPAKREDAAPVGSIWYNPRRGNCLRVKRAPHDVWCQEVGVPGGKHVLHVYCTSFRHDGERLSRPITIRLESLLCRYIRVETIELQFVRQLFMKQMDAEELAAYTDVWQRFGETDRHTLDSILGNPFRQLRMICRRAERLAKKKRLPAWSIVGDMTANGSGMSSAIWRIFGPKNAAPPDTRAADGGGE